MGRRESKDLDGFPLSKPSPSPSIVLKGEYYFLLIGIIIKEGASQLALVVKNRPSNAGDVRDSGLIPGSGRSPGEGHGHPLQYSCLENPMDRGAWRTMVHRVRKSWTQLKQLSIQALLKKTEAPSFNSAIAWESIYMNIHNPWETLWSPCFVDHGHLWPASMVLQNTSHARSHPAGHAHAQCSLLHVEEEWESDRSRLEVWCWGSNLWLFWHRLKGIAHSSICILASKKRLFWQMRVIVVYFWLVSKAVFGVHMWFRHDPTRGWRVRNANLNNWRKGLENDLASTQPALGMWVTYKQFLLSWHQEESKAEESGRLTAHHVSA